MDCYRYNVTYKSRFSPKSLRFILFAAIFWGLYGLSSVGHADQADPVTAIAAMSNEASAFVGYESGAVAFCTGYPYPCQVYSGTPNSPVTAMDISRGGDQSNYWVFVGYQNGEVYLCSFTHARTCRPFTTKK